MSEGESRDGTREKAGGVNVGDRFVQVMPFGTAQLVVESVVDDEHVGVLRSGGARQVFPVSTLTNPCYWTPMPDPSGGSGDVAGDEAGVRSEHEAGMIAAVSAWEMAEDEGVEAIDALLRPAIATYVESAGLVPRADLERFDMLASRAAEARWKGRNQELVAELQKAEADLERVKVNEYDCPHAKVCETCPCAGEDDVCFPGERLRADLEACRAERDELRAHMAWALRKLRSGKPMAAEEILAASFDAAVSEREEGKR